MKSKDLSFEAPSSPELALVVTDTMNHSSRNWTVIRKTATSRLLPFFTPPYHCHSNQFSLFPNNILTSLLTHPDLMNLLRGDIDPRPDTERLLDWILVPWVGDG
jgi:hypothetical protein